MPRYSRRLTTDLENYVKAKVATGRYHSASEMKLEALRHEISQGMTSVEQGQSKPLDIETIKAEGRFQRKGKLDQRDP